MRVFVGTYTTNLGHVHGIGKGIHLCELDPSDGLLRTLAIIPADNPSFLALHPSGATLYAVNEAVADPAVQDGALSAFRITRGTGQPIFLNARPSRGRAPCHLIVDRAGRFLFNANYGSGNFVAHRIEPDGSLGDATGEIRHEGKGVDPVRQEGPHAHSLAVAPGPDAGRFFVTGCDLGLDEVFVFSIEDTGVISVHSHAPIHPGWGPRQLELGRAGAHAYVMTEMGAQVCVFDWIAAEGRLVQTQAVPVLDDADPGPRQGTDVRLSPDGRHAYATNRAADCISCFDVDQSTGLLRPLFRQRLPGRTPRHAALSPDGRLLLIACQDSNEILVYRRDGVSGGLSLMSSTAISTPSCILFA